MKTVITNVTADVPCGSISGEEDIRVIFFQVKGNRVSLRETVHTAFSISFEVEQSWYRRRRKRYQLSSSELSEVVLSIPLCYDLR